MMTLPRSLAEFGVELEHAISRDLGRRPARRRRIVVRMAVIGAAAAAAVSTAGVVREFTGQGPSIVERAAAALAAPPESILHVRVEATQADGDGTIVNWQTETWQATYLPKPLRQIERIGDRPAVETTTSGTGLFELYDPERNVIYVASESDLADGVEPAQQPPPKRTRDAGHPSAEPWDGGTAVEPLEIDSAEALRAQVLELLRSSRVSVDRRTRNRDTVRITFADGRTSYLFDASTYAPIELRTRGTTVSTVLRFRVYEMLRAADANRALLSLAAQHPDARVVRDRKRFRAAQRRLLATG